MKRDALEEYLNKKVTITLFDNQKVTGILQQGNGYFYTLKYYHVINAHGKIEGCVFRSSHVKKLEEIK